MQTVPITGDDSKIEILPEHKEMVEKIKGNKQMINPVSINQEQRAINNIFIPSLEKEVNKRLLFFDTETTGLGADARIVQIAWVVFNLNGSLISEADFFIKPDNFTIPDQVVRIHGIATEKVKKYGKPVDTVLEGFIKDVAASDCIIGHNIDFDIRMIGNEMLIKSDRREIFKDKEIYCTQKLSTNFCELPGQFEGKFKWPKLTELYAKLFGCSFANAHDALADIKATAKCFFELKKLGVIKINKETKMSEDKIYSEANHKLFADRIKELRGDDKKTSYEIIAYVMGEEGFKEANQKGEVKKISRKLVSKIFNQPEEQPAVETEATEEVKPELATHKEVDDSSVTRDDIYQEIIRADDLWRQVKQIKKEILPHVEKLNSVDKKILIYDVQKGCKAFNTEWIASELFNTTPKNILEISKGLEAVLNQ